VKDSLPSLSRVMQEQNRKTKNYPCSRPGSQKEYARARNIDRVCRWAGFTPRDGITCDDGGFGRRLVDNCCRADGLG
jgi:hypothetical protein